MFFVISAELLQLCGNDRPNTSAAGSAALGGIFTAMTLPFKEDFVKVHFSL